MGKGEPCMGKVMVEIEVANYQDEGLVQAGVLPPGKVRKVQLKALVDTGATLLVLPEDAIEKLGLPVLRKASTRLGDGRFVTRTVYGSAKLAVQRRLVTVDVLSAPQGVPPLLGQIPLEGLDLIVDSKNQRLIPNPESPDPETALVDML